MKAHLRLGRLFGIDIRLHASFLLILAWAMWNGWRDDGWRQGLWSVLFVICVFGCIVLHELGHSLAARRYGIGAQAITLYPIGGVAGLTRLPRRPIHEIVIALAGPTVSLALGALLLALCGGVIRWETIAQGPGTVNGLIETLAAANFILAGFNLLPAFPMDGGRVLRASLSLAIGYERATVVAAIAGQIFAACFFVIGWLVRHPLLMALGLFLAWMARREAAYVRARDRLGNRLVADLMDADPPRIDPDAPLGSVSVWPTDDYSELPVVVAGRIVGLLDRSTVTRALRNGAEEIPVRIHMRRGFLAVPPDGRLGEMIGWLPRTGQQVYPVVSNGFFVGLLRLSDVLDETGRRRRPPGKGFWRLDLG